MEQGSRKRPGRPRPRPSEEGSEPGENNAQEPSNEGQPLLFYLWLSEAPPQPWSVSEMSGGWIGLDQ